MLKIGDLDCVWLVLLIFGNLICMLSYYKTIVIIVSSVLVFHTVWVIPAFVYYFNNQTAKKIFELVHPGANYATIQGYLVSDLWIIVYTTIAVVIFVFFSNLFSGFLSR